jgi:ribosome biogenesis GTPase
MFGAGGSLFNPFLPQTRPAGAIRGTNMAKSVSRPNSAAPQNTRARAGNVNCLSPGRLVFNTEYFAVPIEDHKTALTLETLGWTPELENLFAEMRARHWEPGRIVVEDKHHYVVFTWHGALIGRASGKMLHTTRATADLPKVGDWVALVAYPVEEKALIHQVLPRQTCLSRKLTGRETAEQVMVTNVTTAFIVQAANAFNPRLLERYLLMANEGGIRAVLLLNKCDLCKDAEAMVLEAETAAKGTPVLAVSAKTGRGIKRLSEMIQPRQAVVFIGPSGVGKSSLINRLYGEEVAATTEVREGDSKGRHTTTWRELIVLPKGGLVIDTPGMREFHLWMAGEGLQDAFPDIVQLALSCKFTSCAHGTEKGCSVQAALASGQLTAERLNSFQKLQHELEYLEKAGHVRRRKEGGRPRDFLAAHEEKFENRNPKFE